jgi:hypothetical protein
MRWLESIQKHQTSIDEHEHGIMRYDFLPERLCTVLVTKYVSCGLKT